MFLEHYEIDEFSRKKNSCHQLEIDRIPPSMLRVDFDNTGQQQKLTGGFSTDPFGTHVISQKFTFIQLVSILFLQ